MHAGEHHYKSRKNIFHKPNINQIELKASPIVGNSQIKILVHFERQDKLLHSNIINASFKKICQFSYDDAQIK